MGKSQRKALISQGLFESWRPGRGRSRTRPHVANHVEIIDFFGQSPLKNNSLLTEKYVAQGLSTTQIAAECGVSRSAVKERLREIGVLNGRPDRSHYLTGQVPFGWKKEHGKLVPHLAEQRILAEILVLRESGKSLRSIADILNKKSIKSKNGQAWHAESVRRVLQNKRSQGAKPCNPHSKKSRS